MNKGERMVLLYKAPDWGFLQWVVYPIRMESAGLSPGSE